MTVDQTITWTPLPRGHDVSGNLRLAIHVAPRLTTGDSNDTTLDPSFPDFVNWAATPVSFGIRLGGAAEVPATIVSVARDSQLWTTLFPPNTLVRSFVPESLSSSKVRSYPVADVIGSTRSLYSTIAADPATASDLPALGTLRSMLGAIDFDPKANPKDQYIAAIEAELTANRFVAPGAPSPATTAKSFLQLEQFLQPRGGPATLPLPARDFREVMLGVLQHPLLMRLLGVVFEVTIPSPGGTDVVQSTVQVVPHWTTQLVPATQQHDVTPITNCVYGPGIFLATHRATAPMLFGGLLPLNDSSQYRLTQLDPERAGMKLLRFTELLARADLGGKPGAGTPTNFALPSLRSIGLSVARVGLPADDTKRNAAGELVRTLDRNDALNTAISTNQVVLDAEDVTHGFRFDVWDSLTHRWHALTARQGTYEFPTIGRSIPVLDAAFVTSGPGSAADGSSSDLWLQQSLVHWKGWSLAVPRPGGTVFQGQVIPEPQPQLDPAFPMLALFEALPGSLPRLRFGVQYYVRARAVDLAGNSIDFGTTDPVEPGTPEFASSLPIGPLTYNRFEPVPSPPVWFRAPKTPGESMERVVLRSNFNTPPVPSTVERHVVPPVTSAHLVEHHGVLDVTPGGPPDPAAYSVVATRDAYAWDAQADTVHPEAEVTVGWLPDVFGRAASFVGLPGVAPGVAVVVGFNPDAAPWPARRPFRLAVTGGTGAPVLTENPTERVLTVHLDKADIADVRLSSVVASGDLDLLGIWALVVAANPSPTDLATLTQLAITGRHWMLTPFRNVRLVHAVRQPLLAPVFQEWTLTRSIGDTFAALDGSAAMNCSYKSTGRMQLDATWFQPFDAGPGGPEPSHLPAVPPKTAQAVVRLPLVPGPKPDKLPLNHVHHEFHDTKRRNVTYVARATSAFTEYFQEATTLAVSAYGTGMLLDARGVEQGSVRVTSADGATPYPGEGPATPWTMDYTTGKITFNDVPGGVPLGSSVQVQFLPPVSRRSPQPSLRVVPASARPAAPKVEYVVPAFQWSLGTTANTITSSRQGFGLRVYLQRPWWTSGEEEMLGVLTYPDAEQDNPPALPERLSPYVTSWGSDPVYDAFALPSTYPRLASFPDAVTTAQGLFLDELPHEQGTTDLKVNVAAHAVDFDVARDLWFCDLRVTATPAYFPMIRLALARFQPAAVTTLIDDVHLSRVVLADIVPLAPDRTAVVVFDSPTQATVTVSGHTPSRTERQSGPGNAVMFWEKRSTSVPDADIGWTPSAKKVPMRVITGVGGDYQWRATIRFPSAAQGTGKFRLVIQQSDIFRSYTAVGPNSPRASGIVNGPRLVYTDVIPL